MARILLAPVLALTLVLAACTGVRLPPPPEAPSRDLIGLARLPGVPDGEVIRFWGDLAPAAATEQLQLIRDQVAARIRAEGAAPNNGRYDVLALSGGGSDGAYGAGLINGWSAREAWTRSDIRPEFSLVTGISVGALIAPFAFLGPEYNDELERLFTTTETADVAEFNVFRALFGYELGLTNLRPLERILDQMLTDAMVARIAEEHLKGRRLWIGTTYLDAQRPVIWDIGAIAVADYDDKRDLIKKILLASSAIPGAFPPVLFPVESGGEIYNEMHVDGSVTQQLFIYPSNIDLGGTIDQEVPGMVPGTIYLIRNSKLAPDFQPVEPSVLRIVERSLFTLTNALALGDAEGVEQQASRDGWRLLRSSVPLEFDYPISGFFDPQYMSELFQVGYRRAADGIVWEKVFDPGEIADPVLNLAGGPAGL